LKTPLLARVDAVNIVVIVVHLVYWSSDIYCDECNTINADKEIGLEVIQQVRTNGEGETVVGVIVQALADESSVVSPVVPDKVPSWYLG
jgi:hypothetical protein